MKRVADTIKHTLLIFNKKHLSLGKRFSLWFAYLRVTGKRFLIGKVPFLDSSTVSFLGYKVQVGLYSDFYWTFIEIFLTEDYYFSSEKENPLVIDCGTNIGINILYVKWLYPKAEIIAFEMC